MDLAKQLGINDSALRSIAKSIGQEISEGQFDCYRAIVEIKRKNGISYRQAALQWLEDKTEPLIEKTLDDRFISLSQPGFDQLNSDDSYLAHTLAQTRADRVVEASESLFPAYLAQSVRSRSGQRSHTQCGMEDFIYGPLLKSAAVELLPPLTPITPLLTPSIAA
jgi:hypothetical protein